VTLSPTLRLSSVAGECGLQKVQAVDHADHSHATCCNSAARVFLLQHEPAAAIAQAQALGPGAMGPA
jgi:hypothetical protein